MSEERKESAVINFENQNGWDSQRTAEGELELNFNKNMGCNSPRF